jgi:hypothetical protein
LLQRGEECVELGKRGAMASQYRVGNGDLLGELMLKSKGRHKQRERAKLRHVLVMHSGNSLPHKVPRPSLSGSPPSVRGRSFRISR